MNYMRLLKLLYIAEREAIAEGGLSITGSRPLAMERGPVLEEVYKLIKNEHVQTPIWSEFIRRDNYHLVLERDPGVGKLSEFFAEILEQVLQKHQNDDEWAMVQHVHEFPEWKKNNPGKSCKRIPFEDFLEAIGAIAKKEEIVENAKRLEFAQDFFAPHEPAH